MLKALHSIREICKCVVGRSRCCLIKWKKKVKYKTILSKEDVYTFFFFLWKKMQGTVDILFKVATSSRGTGGPRRESHIFILYLFCLNAQLHIILILKIKAGVIWETVVHFVCWFSSSLYYNKICTFIHTTYDCYFIFKNNKEYSSKLHYNPTLCPESSLFWGLPVSQWMSSN